MNAHSALLSKQRPSDASSAPLSIWNSIWKRSGATSIIDGTIRMHAELQGRGFKSELRVMKGEHTWDLWQAAVEPALEWLSTNLDAACPTNERE
jgi:S-formylglutathione hydrolase FrmB